MDQTPDSNLVLLVTLDVMTPFRKGEVFGVSPEMAEKLLTKDMTLTDFGPKYPVVKCRRYNPEKDQELLLANRTLNQREHKKLEEKLTLQQKQTKQSRLTPF